jgi:hypothetical protein
MSKGLHAKFFWKTLYYFFDVLKFAILTYM